jgi:hypothetical protein
LMRTVIGILCGMALVAGCAHPKTAGNNHAIKPEKVVIHPDLRPVGKVQLVNAQGRFVVMNFLAGQVPALNTHLSVYRDGLKVGDVKVTGPERESDTVGDIMAGEIQVHDEVRAE